MTNTSEIYNVMEKGVWRKLNIRTAGTNTIAFRLAHDEWYIKGITGLIHCNSDHTERLEEAYQNQKCPVEKVEEIKPLPLMMPTSPI